MPEATLRALTVADTAALQCALALMTGGWASAWWLRRAISDWARAVVRRSRRWLVVGAVLALAAECAGVWLQAAALVDAPTQAVAPLVAMVLRETHFGHAWWFGSAALLVALGAAPMAAGVAQGIAAAAVAVFAFSRSVVSHAGAQGDFSLQVGVDAVHLLLVCLWVGSVLMGLDVLRRPPGSRTEGSDAARWVSSLSATATAALVAIVMTGALKVWWATPSWQMLVGSDYGRVLCVKLLLVGAAAALGGFNRFRTMPGLLQDLGRAGPSEATLRHRFARIVGVEAAVLVGAVIAAAVLSSTATPGEG